MGKSARLKAERRAAAEQAVGGAARRPLPLFWITLALLVVGTIVAFVVTAPSDADRERTRSAAKVPAFAAVTVSGAELPTWTGGDDDAAVGRQVPTLSALTFERRRTTVTPGEGVARVYVVVAHWCPHCQDEVPRLVRWTKQRPLPAGVELTTVSTAVDEAQPNYPPAEWLARERWPWQVLVDDEVGSAAEALGVEGFPFLVFADEQGRVVERFSGEMPRGAFEDAVRAIAPADEARG